MDQGKNLLRKIDNIIHITRHNSGDVIVEHDTHGLIKLNIIILGVIETLLGLRFLFMLLGANPRSGFTAFLYAITGIFIAPFSGIFNPVSTTGLATRSVFDPATIIAMAIYALVGWGIVKLLWIRASKNGY